MFTPSVTVSIMDDATVDAWKGHIELYQYHSHQGSVSASMLTLALTLGMGPISILKCQLALVSMVMLMQMLGVARVYHIIHLALLEVCIATGKDNLIPLSSRTVKGI